MNERLSKRRSSDNSATPSPVLAPDALSGRAALSGNDHTSAGQLPAPLGAPIGASLLEKPALPPQPNLPVSQPGDSTELEADAVADEITRADAIDNAGRPVLPTRSIATVARTATPAAPGGPGGPGAQSGSGSTGSTVLGSGGQPLSDTTREFFEPRFGHDFSRIRIHSGPDAAASAQSFAARAYTLGTDIVFAPGEYAPESEAGRHLLAHELTHTIQQSSGTPATIQREPNASMAPPNSSLASTPPVSVQPPPTGTTPPPAAAADQKKTVTYKGKTLYGDATAAKKMVYDMLAADGYKATIAFLDDLGTLTTRDQDFTAAFKPEENEAANLCVNTTASQKADVVKAHDKLLDDFEEKARTRVWTILEQSEKRIQDERVKYGIPEIQTHKDKDSGAAIDTTPRTMADNEATKALATAAGELVPPRRALEALIKKYDACFESAVSNNEVPGMPAKRVKPGKEDESAELNKQIEEARRQFNILRAAKERDNMILAAYGPEGEANTDSLENIAKGTASQGWAFWKKNAADELVPMIAEKLHNIDTVRAAVAAKELKVWSNQTLVTGTKGELGFTAATWEGKVIDEKVKEVHDDEFLVNLLVGVLAIGLGLIAIFATAGTATAAVAAVGSAALSGVQAANTLSNYTMAQAENGTDFDKSRAISQEDPSLVWLALDLIGAALDFKAALSAFKVLGPAIREAVAAGKSAESMEKLGATLDKYPPAVKAKVLAHIAAASDLAKPALDELEKVARAQYKALSDAGRLKEIGDVTEDVFVKQMLSSGKAHIIISGEEGVRRTGLVTALMQPGNERIAAILKGEEKAIKGLIIEHGNWKQLLTMLDQGTPEMRQAGAKLFEHRQGLLGTLEKDFHAKPVSGASTEKISDIDLSTFGNDAGADMIKAEEHMKNLYGPGWSESLRMNFYTEAGRLTAYEKVMPGLSKADAAALLGQVTADAEKLNVAKMLAHAEGDPSLLAQVEAYAKKMGVDVKDPKIQELVPKLAGGGDVVARNKLLLEIDGLSKELAAAKEGSPEQLDLVKRITSKQMEVNAMTPEAYIGPGAGRMTVSGIKVVGQEAYQAAMSNLEMIQHILHETAGDVVTASREYEIYKYINRFAEAAENAGAKTQGLDYWKNFSGFASKTERQATSDAVHLAPRTNATVPKGGQPFLPDSNPTIGPVTDQFLKEQYEAWNAFSEQAIGDLKKISQENPAAWTPFNSPRPAAGTP